MQVHFCFQQAAENAVIYCWFAGSWFTFYYGISKMFFFPCQPTLPPRCQLKFPIIQWQSWGIFLFYFCYCSTESETTNRDVASLSTSRLSYEPPVTLERLDAMQEARSSTKQNSTQSQNQNQPIFQVSNSLDRFKHKVCSKWIIMAGAQTNITNIHRCSSPSHHLAWQQEVGVLLLVKKVTQTQVPHLHKVQCHMSDRDRDGNAQRCPGI